jgi:hypothetical protein
LLRREIDEVRTAIWHIREEINDSYDFGLLTVDCSPFKYDILAHCLKLEDHLVEYIKSEFETKLIQVDAAIEKT